MKRTFTDAEIRQAQAMRADGKNYKQIAHALGRTSGDGIKRRLDQYYRYRRNAYHVAYRAGRRAEARAP